jgi:hypothetical protein
VTHFFAIYVKHPESRLVLMRRSPTGDDALVAKALQAANTKAEELGWTK